MEGHWVTGYTFAKPGSKPRVFAEYNFATGDANPTDQVREGFDQLYPTPHDKTGLADQAECPGETPVAVISKGTCLSQTCRVRTLADMVENVLSTEAPGIIVIGRMVAFRSPTYWFEFAESTNPGK
jgi:hypothetical protein